MVDPRLFLWESPGQGKTWRHCRTVGKPVVIIQKSVKGKGVSFMENQVGWHGKAPNQAEYEQAMAELTAQLKELEG